MEKLKINSYTTKDKLWVDEAGVSIPFNRTTKAERLTERTTKTMLAKAIGINKQLADFKAQVASQCDKVVDAVVKEISAGKPTKGNFTFFSFDRSIKVAVSISESIVFDDITISAAKAKLDGFLEASIQGEQIIKSLVMDAFNKSKGSLDVKKVLSLLKYKGKVNDARFTEALDLIEKAIRKPESKSYFRIWGRLDNGEYQQIDLNFSSI